MSLKRLLFEKLWTSSEDFPTLEENEERVRKDFQYHPDAIKNFLNSVLLPALEKLGVEKILCTADPDALKYLKVSPDGEWFFSADGEVWEKFHKKGGGIWLAPDYSSVDGLRGLIDISLLTGNSKGDVPTADDVLTGDMVLCRDGGLLIVTGFATSGATVYVTCTGGASDDPADGAAINLKGETGDIGVFTPDGESGPLPVAAGGTGAADADTARAKLGAAPAGYGLGTDTAITISSVKELDNYTANGWYKFYCQGSCLNNIWFNYAFVRVSNYGKDSHCLQEIYPVGFTSPIVRCLLEGVWGEPECDNPPMVPGVEYRTTERWNGKVVWTVAYNLGTLPNNTAVTLLSAPITFTEIVDVRGKAFGTGGYNPMSNTGGLSDFWITGGDQMHFNVLTTTDFSDKTLTIIVKYTKD